MFVDKDDGRGEEGREGGISQRRGAKVINEGKSIEGRGNLRRARDGTRWCSGGTVKVVAAATAECCVKWWHNGTVEGGDHQVHHAMTLGHAYHET